MINEETVVEQNDAVNDAVIQSEGVKPDNFDELPSVEIKNPEDELVQQKRIQKWGTARYPKIEWEALENRRLFFSLLMKTFEKKCYSQKGKHYYKSVYSYVDRFPVPKYKNAIANVLDKTKKEKVNCMVFDSPKHRVKFGFDLNETLNMRILKGDERNIFRLFLKNFDQDFKEIAEEEMRKNEATKAVEPIVEAAPAT